MLLRQLLSEQRRTNRLIQGLFLAFFGFVLGALAAQAWVHWHGS
jgi:hypothetical protein